MWLSLTDKQAPGFLWEYQMSLKNSINRVVLLYVSVRKIYSRSALWKQLLDASNIYNTSRHQYSSPYRSSSRACLPEEWIQMEAATVQYEPEELRSSSHSQRFIKHTFVGKCQLKHAAIAFKANHYFKSTCMSILQVFNHFSLRSKHDLHMNTLSNSKALMCHPHQDAKCHLQFRRAQYTD